MSTALLRLQKIAHQKVHALHMPSISIPWNTVLVTGAVLLSLLAVSYVLQVNQLTKGYYTINTYQKSIQTLAEENRTLQVSFNESNFVSQVIAQAQAMDLQPSSSVQYVKVLDDSFAFAK